MNKLLTQDSASDLDAITRNLIALDLAHIDPEEAPSYEHELSVIASLNEALETIGEALNRTDSPHLWQRLQPLLSDAAALLASQIAPLLALNAERHEDMATAPIALTTHSPNTKIAIPQESYS